MNIDELIDWAMEKSQNGEPVDLHKFSKKELEAWINANNKKRVNNAKK